MISLPRIIRVCISLVVVASCFVSGIAVAQPVNADPLAGLPPAVDLPEVKTGEWVTLSKIAVPDDLILIFRLIGGDRCLKEGRRFETKELAGNRIWQVLITGAAGTAPVEVARFRVQDQQLQFAWIAGAEAIADAAMLSNTAGEFVVARTNRLVAFRKPQQAQRLEISFQESTAVYYEIPNMPRLDKMLIEIDMKAAGRGGAGNWRLLGNGPALKPHDDRWFAESINPGQWAVKIESSYGKTLKIRATPVFWIANRNKLQPLTATSLKTALNQLNAYEAKVAALHSQLRANTPQVKVKSKGKGKGKGKAKYRPGPNPQADAAARELNGVRAAKAKLTTLQQFVAANQPGSIHFRISQDFDGFLLPIALTR